MPARDVWRIGRAGSLDRLRRQRDEVPPPGPGEVRVSVRAIGLNLADVFACLGLYSATPRGPFVPGLEFSGVVDAVGPSRPGDEPMAGGPAASSLPGDRGTELRRREGLRPGGDLQPGDRVVGLTRFGACATAVTVDARYLRALPSFWSFAEGAAFPVQALTAWYAIHEMAHLEAGEAVLVHSAAGGVGLNALRILGASGAKVVATVGRDDKKSFLVQHQGLRAVQVIVRDRRRFGRQLDRALADCGLTGFDVVLDGIGGPFFRPAFERLGPEGRLVLFGAADMMPAGARPNYLRLAPKYWRRPRLDPMAMMAQNRSVMAFNLIWLWDRVDRLAALYDRTLAVVERPPFVGRTFPFDEAPAALRWLQGGESIGKVVVEVAEP